MLASPGWVRLCTLFFFFFAVGLWAVLAGVYFFLGFAMNEADFGLEDLEDVGYRPAVCVALLLGLIVATGLFSVLVRWVMESARRD